MASKSMRFSSSPTAIYFLGLFSVMLGSFPCAAWSQESLFQDISQAVGIDLEGLHHATAIGDYDRDGFQDIYVGTKNSANKLFRNLGNMEFQEVAVAAGVDDSGNTQATIWGDFNNDGYLDLVNGNYLQSNRFYQNNGDGTFSDMTAALGIGNLGPCRSLHAADYDQDGWLDLYVVNINSHSVMWRNLNGTGFQNTTFPSGTVDVGIGMGSLFFDADNDGDVDLYLTHDGNQVNRYYRNDGDGTFTEAAAEVGLDYQGNCMGVDAADINHDGWMDLYITDLYPSELFINDGDGTFTAIGEASGVDDTGMTWGCAWFDYDNDSETDLYIVNDYAFAAYPNLLYRGLGGLAFEITSTGIPDLEHPFQDYGMAQGDLDGDGDLDVAIATSGSSIQPGFTVLENLNTTGHAAHIRLEGTVSNRDAVGARVIAYFDNQVRTDEVHCGQGYSGSSSFQVHFGLGESTSLDSVVIRWPNGIVSQQGPLDADTLYHILEPGSEPWFFTGCTDSHACNFQLGAVVDDASCSYPEAGLNCDGTPIVSFPTLETHSIARIWSEALLTGIRNDWARPTIHARNLWHSSALMYDAWCAFSEPSAISPKPWLLGDTIEGYVCPFDGIAEPLSAEARLQARESAISYGVYRLMKHRFAQAPRSHLIHVHIDSRMISLGYDTAFVSTDFDTGDPALDAAALGNYLAEHYINFGLQDGSHEELNYQNTYYNPINWNLVMDDPGNPNLFFPNRWQPLQLAEFIDQSGNEGSNISPEFLSPEWGDVTPFAMNPSDTSVYQRLGSDYTVYHDPGPPPFIDPNEEVQLESDYKWGHLMVSLWSSHLDPSDSVIWDISPGAFGRDGYLPLNMEEARSYYVFEEGGITEGSNGLGHAVNPTTQEPYAPQPVLRGDFTRVLAEFWADGPESETPPGHWFDLLNYVNDQPELERKWRGTGATLSLLDWDVLAYFSLGGAMHDAAIAAWSCKGWYDYLRPVSALRWMADQGQCSDPELPHYNGAGLPLVPGYVELITAEDSVDLRGENNEFVDDIKLKAWRGPSAIDVPAIDQAGVGWIRAKEWWPYQRPTFVTPPFAGYVSGHSTFSRAAAEVLTLMTGDPFFPGGIGTFTAEANSFLVFEDGPTHDIELQWATYRDAADQSGLSRIWGGIHPPQDDFPGRMMGEVIGVDAFLLAEMHAFPLLVTDCTGLSDCPCFGDFNADGARNLFDLLILLVHYGQTTGLEGNGASPIIDLDSDGMIDTGDLLGLLTVWGFPCTL
ncbi:MAG TPA: hypothetical protein DCX00_08815 [Flavobacteriales bacterium]|nr:hypothetical protein [Flavobacteriales bacterium]